MNKIGFQPSYLLREVLLTLSGMHSMQGTNGLPRCARNDGRKPSKSRRPVIARSVSDAAIHASLSACAARHLRWANTLAPLGRALALVGYDELIRI